MAGHSPGIRASHKETSVLELNPVNDAANIQGLSSLCEILASSFGHRGHVKVIHNNCGGDVMLTSISERLLQLLSISKAVLKLITTVMKEHTKTYSDGGLFLGVFALKLIINALKLNIHRHLIIEVYDLLLKECIKVIESSDYRCRQEICTSDNEFFIRLARSMYSSKPGCLLFDSDIDHLTYMTVDGYRKCHIIGCLPETSKLLYVTIDGKPPKDSRLVSGVLYESPHLPVYCQHSVHLPSDKNVTSVVLVQMSMAGDSDGFLDVNYELTAGIQLSDAVVNQLLHFADNIAAAGVGALICQKVVHPKVKRFLREHHVVVLDRLGTTLFEAVHMLAGGSIIDPFSCTSSMHYTSVLGHLQQVIINNKSYIHLDGLANEEGKHSPVYTVILCHRTPDAVQEVKMVYEKSQHVLSLTEKCQQVLCGGGCWQSALLLHIRDNIPALINQWVIKLECSKTLLSEIADTFMMSLQQIVILLNGDKQGLHLVDRSTGHYFITTQTDHKPVVCNCGAVSYNEQSHAHFIHLDDLGKSTSFSDLGSECVQKASSVGHMTTLNDKTVVDAYLPFINAIKAAVSLSSMILGIHNCIHDKS